MGETTGKLLATRRNSSRYGGGMLVGGQGKNGSPKAFLSVLLVMIVVFQLGLLFGLPKQRGGPAVPGNNNNSQVVREKEILCKDGDSFVPCPRNLGQKIEHSSRGERNVQEQAADTVDVDGEDAVEGHRARDDTMSGSQKNKEYELPGQKFRQRDDLRNKKEESVRFDDASTGKERQNRNTFLDEDEGTNPIAAGALLDLLKETEPEAGRPLTVKFMRSRIAAFRKYLIVSRNLKKSWNDQFAQSQQRGILIAAGRAGAVLNAYVVMYTLRHGVKSTLPVVIAHYGDTEFKKATRDFFQVVFNDLSFLDLETEEYPDHHLPIDSGGNRRELGYKLKVYSMYKAPLREMIFMDADATPLQDPSILFESKAYGTYKNMFWNDFWKDPVPLWPMLHLRNDPWILGSGIMGSDDKKRDNGGSDDQSTDEQSNGASLDSLTEEEIAKRSLRYPFEAESGQIVLDRLKYWEVLEWVLFLNTHDSYVYRFAMGDKDTYRVAFALAGKSDMYYSSPLAPSLPLADLGPKGEEVTDPSIRYRCLGMLQLHPETGSPLFHHRTADSKFRPLTDPKEYLSPITHVTPPITQDQASIMNWGNPGYSIFQAAGSVTWGIKSKSALLAKCKEIPKEIEDIILGKSNHVLDEKEVASSSCPCPPIRLQDANMRCMGKDAMAVEMEPEPILVIEVPKSSYIYRISRVETDAYGHIPFQELE